MDDILYEAFIKYYNVLETLGYISQEQSNKLLVLSFYNDFLYKDFNGIVDVKDYSIIDKALNCIYGSSCLIPYPTYLDMGKLYVNEYSEMASRIAALENANVVKVANEIEEESDSDIIIISDEDGTF